MSLLSHATMRRTTEPTASQTYGMNNLRCGANTNSCGEVEHCSNFSKEVLEFLKQTCNRIKKGRGNISTLKRQLSQKLLRFDDLPYVNSLNCNTLLFYTNVTARGNIFLAFMLSSAYNFHLGLQFALLVYPLSIHLLPFHMITFIEVSN
jgi:hypothetical protein